MTFKNCIGKLRIALFIIVFICLITPIALYVCLFPKQSGEIIFKGKSNFEKIAIHRDSFAIPHIKTKTMIEAFYAMGFTHAQDRIWSMHVLRILASGRLSEFFGEEFVELDILIKTIGLYRIAQENERHLFSEEIDIFEAYSSGINDQINAQWIPPLEFLLTNANFQEWKTIDTLVISKLISLGLTGDWYEELIRTKLLEYFSRDFVEEMLPLREEFLFDNTVILNMEELKDSGLFVNETIKSHNPIHSKSSPPKNINSNAKEHEKYNIFANDLNNGGSNNWVIHGNHTKFGKPILANDPHLFNRIPSWWQLMEIIWSNNSIIGGTFPGVPAFLLGKTDQIAFGITSLHGDGVDLFQEKINENGTSFIVYDKNINTSAEIQFENIKETIHIKNKPSLVHNVRLAMHGISCPFISKINSTKQTSLNFGENLSFCWTGNSKTDNTLQGMLLLYNSTGNASEIALMKQYINIGINFVQATKQGDIGQLELGKLPLKNYLSQETSFVRDGTNPANNWNGIIQKQDMAEIVNPRKGFISTANNKVGDSNYLKHHASLPMGNHARANRMHNKLSEMTMNKHKKISIKDMMELQLDTLDIQAQRYVPKVLKLINLFKNEIETYSEIEHIIDQIQNWDFKMEKHCKGAIIFMYWEYFFFQKGLKKLKSNSELLHLFSSSELYANYVLRKIEEWHNQYSIANISHKCDKIKENEFTPCDILFSFFEVKDLLSNNISKINWKIEKMMQQEWTNIPFSFTFLGQFFSRFETAQGNKRTINVAFPKLKENGVFFSSVGANARMLIDLSDEGKSFQILDTGQSESVFSYHYDDQMELHSKGQYIEMKCGTANLPNNSILHLIFD